MKINTNFHIYRLWSESCSWARRKLFITSSSNGLSMRRRLMKVSTVCWQTISLNITQVNLDWLPWTFLLSVVYFRAVGELDQKVSHPPWTGDGLPVSKLYAGSRIIKHSNCKLLLRWAWWSINCRRPESVCQLWRIRRADLLLLGNSVELISSHSLSVVHVRIFSTSKYHGRMCCYYLLFLCSWDSHQHSPRANGAAQLRNAVHCVAIVLPEFIYWPSSEPERPDGSSEKLCNGEFCKLLKNL